jgi:hypothetical protein
LGFIYYSRFTMFDNYLEKIGRMEGFKNPEDIFDTTTFADIKKELENIKPADIEENLDKEKLPPELLHSLENAKSFCIDLSTHFQEAFLALLETYHKEERNISPRIISYLKEKGLDLPKFTISYKEYAQSIVDNFGLDHKVNDDALLLAFKLPKPLAHFWWKGGIHSWGTGGKDVGAHVVEWGDFYRELMIKTWTMQGYYQNERGLRFRRINVAGEHDSKKYYYVWEVE